jgi:hypothetical protein
MEPSLSHNSARRWDEGLRLPKMRNRIAWGCFWCFVKPGFNLLPNSYAKDLRAGIRSSQKPGSELDGFMHQSLVFKRE